MDHIELTVEQLAVLLFMLDEQLDEFCPMTGELAPLQKDLMRVYGDKFLAYTDDQANANEVVTVAMTDGQLDALFELLNTVVEFQEDNEQEGYYRGLNAILQKVGETEKEIND